MTTNRQWTRPSWWLRDSSTGEVVLYQRPNLPLAVWWLVQATRLVQVRQPQRDRLTLVGRAALTTWAGDELLRGSAPYRRVLGGATLLSQVVRLRR